MISRSTITASHAGRRPAGIAASVMLAASFLLPSWGAAAAEPFVAYPGVYPSFVSAVQNAKKFRVRSAVWPGFQREFVITLPGIDIPSDSIKAPACEQKLAAEAKAFTEAFFKNADNTELHNIEMETTKGEDAVAHAFTEEGSLVDALIAKGYARPTGTDTDKPWCEE